MWRLYFLKKKNMNRTKTLTQGAMLLAIYGALVLIDRITTFWLTTFVVLIAPVVIIMYSAMQSLKDGIFLSIGIIILSFLLGNFNTTYLIYVPVGIVTGLTYSFGVSRNMDKRSLLLLAVITYLAGELLAYYIVYPMLGFPISQTIAEYKEIMNQAGNMSGHSYSDLFASAGIDFEKLVPILILVSTMITGAMEGVIIHLLSIFLLRRFKIKDLGVINIWESKPNKVLAYVSFLSTFALVLRELIPNENLYYFLLVLGVLGAIVLLYYGYLFVVLYGHIVLHKNVGGLYVIVCLFIPALLVFLICIGFLYGAGPLRTYLEKKMNIINNTNNNNHE